jgi:hypothetical protein
MARSGCVGAQKNTGKACREPIRGRDAGKCGIFGSARRPAACTSCHVPLPYYCEAPDEVSANWRFGTPSLCPHGCHLMIAELLTGLWTRYDIEA